MTESKTLIDHDDSDQLDDDRLPQFALVLQDPEIVGGDLAIGGGFHPDTLLDDSPAHIVGKFIRDNMESIVAAALEERALAKRLVSPAPGNTRKLILPRGMS